MAQEWFLRSKSGEHGPITSSDMKRLAEAGRITARTLVRKNRDGSWIPAGQVKGLFSRRRPDPLEEGAEALPSFAHMAAVGLFTPLLERSDRLRDALDHRGAKNWTEPWDFFAMAATVCVALMLLREKVPDDRFETLASVPFDRSRSKRRNTAGSPAQAKMQRVIEQLMERWYRHGESAVADCFDFVDHYLSAAATRPNEQAQIAMLAVGRWVIWNILDEKPDDSYDELMVLVGPALSQSVAGYWD